MKSLTPSLAPARTPAYKFGLVVLLGMLLAIPLLSVYLLIYDRESQSDSATTVITAGWGDRQTLSGPFLVVPFTRIGYTTFSEDGKAVTRQESSEESLVIAPTQVTIATRLDPELRKVSIYEAVLYTADVHFQGSFTLPDLAALNIDPASVHFDQAWIAVQISNTKGLAGDQPSVIVDGVSLPLIPGSGMSRNYYANSYYA
ncbi:MAG: cell envelope integrity protein CreD, partial [Pseudomonadales bacterium]|nr:cell envelope integrity protein CreD [Pseudomonadales bacterium]